MITITFGAGNNLEKSAADYRTVGQILQDRGIALYLGFPTGGVSAQVNGRSVDNEYTLRDGDTVNLLTKSNTKG
jgi:hypothetical protein